MPARPRAAVADPAPGLAAKAWSTPQQDAAKLGHCRHKIFGRGKIVEDIPPDKYRVNFPGFGLKVILAAFLEMEA